MLNVWRHNDDSCNFVSGLQIYIAFLPNWVRILCGVYDRVSLSGATEDPDSCNSYSMQWRQGNKLCLVKSEPPWPDPIKSECLVSSWILTFTWNSSMGHLSHFHETKNLKSLKGSIWMQPNHRRVCSVMEVSFWKWFWIENNSIRSSQLLI